jgi:hypothetical protein
MWWHTVTQGGQVKGKLANGVCSHSSHYLETWCIQHYYCWCAHLGCQQSTELTPLADLNRLFFLHACHHISKADYVTLPQLCDYLLSSASTVTCLRCVTVCKIFSLLQRINFQSLDVSLRTARFNIHPTLHCARFAFNVLCGSQNRQRLLFTHH